MQKTGAVGSSQSRSNPTITLRSLEKVSNPKSIHGIYPYRGKMSPIDAAHVISQLPSDAVLLDPFCGTGTVVYEAQVRGMRAIGMDNNPLACIIARGKTEPLDVEETLEHLEQAILAAKNLQSVPDMPEAPAQYFHPVTANQIMRMIVVSDDFSFYEQSALYGSICVAVRACNGWIWTSTSIGRINRPLRDVDFYSTLMRKAKKHISFVVGQPSATIHHHDTRRIAEVVPENSIDVVYCSPPYFDALDYTGYYTKLVLEITGGDRAEIREGLIQRYSTYEQDVSMALSAIDRVVKDDSLIIFVVGDRMVRRKLIRGAEFFAEIAPWNDPYIVERSYASTPSRIWDKINNTQRKEQVIVWDLGA
ncbi:MAG: DNA adenine methylase [Candidatus Sifarchaeia archaeon]